MKLILEQIQTGGDRNFGYLLGDRDAGVAALIDPSYAPEKLIERADAQGLKVEWILNTHGHHDHVNGNEAAKEATGAKIAIYEGSSVPHDVGLPDNGELTIGEIRLTFLHTPGHYPDHLVIYCPDYHFAFTGDHLFVGKVGGTATEEAAKEEFDSLQRIFKELPSHTTVWPGHNYGCRPSSTLELERACNPFVRCQTFEEFLELKANWSAFKTSKGLM
jgi:hydroxyacylglutathione hydrolase